MSGPITRLAVCHASPSVPIVMGEIPPLRAVSRPPRLA